MKIMENLWQVGGAEYTTVEDAAIYLVRLGDKAILIDSGCGEEHEMLVENISHVLPQDSDHFCTANKKAGFLKKFSHEDTKARRMNKRLNF